ncbi:Os06g0325800 [Oryza sativa Japonica Group]|uniref:Os06g0325800 protein n=1 Tax=Oryza sativa subsp. japonica TaxID=39947 RepID=A0A0P0WVZ2_ORYSJ|nr:Os06g0325800 [Oryza sativa Japonica Group]
MGKHDGSAFGSFYGVSSCMCRKVKVLMSGIPPVATEQAGLDDGEGEPTWIDGLHIKMHTSLGFMWRAPWILITPMLTYLLKNEDDDFLKDKWILLFIAGSIMGAAGRRTKVVVEAAGSPTIQPTKQRRTGLCSHSVGMGSPGSSMAEIKHAHHKISNP